MVWVELPVYCVNFLMWSVLSAAEHDFVSLFCITSWYRMDEGINFQGCLPLLLWGLVLWHGPSMCFALLSLGSAPCRTRSSCGGVCVLHFYFLLYPAVWASASHTFPLTHLEERGEGPPEYGLSLWGPRLAQAW